MELTIRPALRADLSTIVGLGEKLHSEQTRYSRPFDRAHAAGFVRWFVEQERCLALVAEQEGEVIGFFLGHLASLAFSPEPVAVDAALYVLPEHRGGVGERLVQAFLDWASPQTDLQVMTETAGAASGAYERLVTGMGFVAAGRVYHRRSGEL